MDKIPNPKYDEFHDLYSSCGLEAVSYVFKLDVEGCKAIFKTMGWKENKFGVTTIQCDKVINLLTKLNKQECEYFFNVRKMSVENFIKNHQKGLFILDCDGHVSTLRNGEVIDSYSLGNYKLLGWWKIKSKSVDSKKCETCKFYPRGYKIKLIPKRFTFVDITRNQDFLPL